MPIENLGSNVPPPVEGSPVWFLRWLEKFRLWIKRELANTLEEIRKEARQASYDSATGKGDTGGTGGGGGGDGKDGIGDPVEVDPDILLPSSALFLASDGVYRGVSGATGLDPQTTVFTTDFLRSTEGWTVGGVGTPSSSWASTLGHPGELTLTTSAAINDTVTLVPDLGIECEVEDIYEFIWVFKLSSTSNVELYIGLGNDVTAAYLGTESAGVYYDGSVFQGFTSEGGVPFDTTSFAATTSYVEFRVKRLGASYQFIANGTVLSSPTIPTGQIEPMVRLVTTGAATRSVTLDYFGIRFNTGARY